MINYEIQFDKETFGLALFWVRGTRKDTHFDFIRLDSLTLIVGPLVIGLSWELR